MNTDTWLTRLDTESKALKVAFDRNANSLLLKTNSISYQTVRNQITLNYNGGSSQEDDPERVILTFNTSSGANTIAKLELTVDNVYARPYVRRLPYSGGARWQITITPKSPYAPTNVEFTVLSLVDGLLSTGEISS